MYKVDYAAVLGKISEVCINIERGVAVCGAVADIPHNSVIPTLSAVSVINLELVYQVVIYDSVKPIVDLYIYKRSEIEKITKSFKFLLDTDIKTEIRHIVGLTSEEIKCRQQILHIFDSSVKGDSKLKAILEIESVCKDIQNAKYKAKALCNIVTKLVDKHILGFIKSAYPMIDINTVTFKNGEITDLFISSKLISGGVDINSKITGLKHHEIIELFRAYALTDAQIESRLKALDRPSINPKFNCTDKFEFTRSVISKISKLDKVCIANININCVQAMTDSPTVIKDIPHGMAENITMYIKVYYPELIVKTLLVKCYVVNMYIYKSNYLGDVMNDIMFMPSQARDWFLNRLFETNDVAITAVQKGDK